MVTFTIDGQRVQGEEGQTILEVAQEIGIEIPTLCYHPLLSPYGACRLCVVEVVAGGRLGLQTACTYPIEEGLEVLTRSPSVIEARKVVLGLLLSRTPNVELIQDLAREYGITEPPFPTDTPDERCILCGHCVRTCHELVKAYVLNFSERGIERRVGPPFLEETRQCIGCGACTIMCPTGAVEIVLEKEAVYKEKPLGPTSAIWVPSMQAVPRVPVIDTDVCIRFRQNDRTEGEIADACGACQMVCEADAVNFDQQDEILELDVGAIIVATGFEMWDPHQLSQYSYGRSPNIITGMEFERLSNASGPTGGEILLADGRKPERVAIIHCIGSRDDEVGEHCSRICCMYALKQAHLVRDKTGAEVYEFYIDMRTAGKGYEEFYKRIQEEGVHFIRGKAAEIQPENGRLLVRAEDTLLGRPVEVAVDMVVLATGATPAQGAQEIARLFSVSQGKEGFFTEAHPKLRPVDTTTDGVFLAGCCQGPKDIPDTVAQASAAASRALILLSQGEVEVEPVTAEVISERCSGCGECVLSCAYTAIALEDGKAVVNAALCKGCGTCAGTCLAKAIVLHHFTDEELVAEVEGIFSGMPAYERVLV